MAGKAIRQSCAIAECFSRRHFLSANAEDCRRQGKPIEHALPGTAAEDDGLIAAR